MRILAVPAALLLALCLYLPLPNAGKWLHVAMRRLYALFLRAFTRKSGQADETPALVTCVLVLGGVLMLLSALHPAVAAVLMAPVFTGLCALPGCAGVKDTLDSGAYAGDIPAYESIVRKACASLAPAFVGGVAAPLLLCAVGTPLHLGPSLGMAHLLVHSLAPQQPTCARILHALHRLVERLFCAFMVLCSCVVGRNPFRTGGHGAEGRLLSILGIAGDRTDTHAPMAGDIPQGIVLCGFSAFLLCFVLCALCFPFCR